MTMDMIEKNARHDSITHYSAVGNAEERMWRRGIGVPCYSTAGNGKNKEVRYKGIRSYCQGYLVHRCSAAENQQNEN